MSVVHRFTGHVTIDEPGPETQFTGRDLDWYHRQGNGWCPCLSPQTSRDAGELEAAQAGSDNDLLAFLTAWVQGCDLHWSQPWAVHMQSLKARREYYQQWKANPANPN